MKKQKKADLPISWRPNLYDYLKILALITMLIDHIGYYLFPEILVLRLIGRIAFPIFLFLVGFNGSFRWRRELFWRGIGIRAFTSFVAWYFSFWSFGANILIAILLARGLIHFLLETKNKILWYVSFLFLLFSHSLMLNFLDYGALSFFFVLRWWKASKDKQWFFLWIPVMIWLFLQNIQVFGFWRVNGNWTQYCILIACFLILILLFRILTKKNYTLSWKWWWSKIILRISQHALLFYGVHIVLLVILGLSKFGRL